MDNNGRMWAMLLHFSVFAGYFAPLAGFLAPILIWQIKKSEFPEIDAHGKVVCNFLISYLIYTVVSIVLMFFIIGIPLLLALSVAGIVLPIIGGIKANNGELWPYPLTIQFIK